MINKSLFLQRKWYFPFAYVSLRKQVHTTATPIQHLFLHLNGLTKKGFKHDLTDYAKGMIVDLRRAGFEDCKDCRAWCSAESSNLKDVQ